MFSFSLVLLCLAVGDIDYVRKHGRCLGQTTYASGWRPRIPPRLREGNPELALLILAMWDGNFRARPNARTCVARLALCTSLTGGSSELSILPPALDVSAQQLQDDVDLGCIPGCTTEMQATVGLLARELEVAACQSNQHILGSFALLRICIQHNFDDAASTACLKEMLELRAEHGCAMICDDVVENDLGPNNGAPELTAAQRRAIFRGVNKQVMFLRGGVAVCSVWCSYKARFTLNDAPPLLSVFVHCAAG